MDGVGENTRNEVLLELLRALVGGLRGNGSLTSITLPHEFLGGFYGDGSFTLPYVGTGGQNWLPETSAAYKAMNRYLERNE